jgi:uncharacterized protein
VPGRAVEVVMRLDQMAYRVPAGHRVRLALATTYWPFVWPSDSNACLTLTEGTITLPTLMQTLPAWVPPNPETAQPWAHKRLREGHASRTIEHDLIRGTHTLIITDDGGEVENLTHGLCSGETMTERWEVHPDDPLSATATHTWEQRLSRGDWRIRTAVTATQTCTATHLRMVAQVRAYEGDVMVFERHFDDSVPRTFV